MKEKSIIAKVIIFIAEELLLFLYLFYILSIGKNTIRWMCNFMGIWAVYGSVFLILLITGLLKDFVKAFSYLFKKKEEIAEISLKRALLSVKAAMAMAVLSNLFKQIIVFIQISNGYQSIELFREGLFVSLAGFGGNAIHGVVAVILLLPVYIRLRLKSF